MSSFLFLEILDREVNLLFSGIDATVTGRLPEKATHLTLRGPYAGEVPGEVIVDCREKMKQDVLRISKVGRFSNPEEEVVYLHVDSPNLRKVWWKRDFPIKRFGFNPHISIYRGHDSALAQKLEAFFRYEEVELLCAEFRLVSHVSRQLEMYPLEVPISRRPFHKLVKGNVKPNMLSRLKVVVMRHRGAVAGSRLEC